MQKKKTMIPAAAFVAATVFATLAAQPARADVDAKCYNEWNGGLMTLAVGQKCNYIDAATSDKIGKAQTTRLQCAGANATPAEKADLDKTAAAAQSDSGKRVAAMQCTADVRKAYDAQVSSLASVAR